jgi:hypothetical protein
MTVRPRHREPATGATWLVAWVQRLTRDKSRRSGLPSSDLYPIFRLSPGDQDGRELVGWFARERGHLPTRDLDATGPPRIPVLAPPPDERRTQTKREEHQ